ncbi:MAG: PKD domain-containing protein, partial [Bacteroidia bacterium]
MKQRFTLLWLIILLGVVAFRADAQVLEPASKEDHDHDHHHEKSVYGDSLNGFDPDAIMAIADSKNLSPYEAALFLGRAQREYINLKYNLTPNSSTAAMYSRMAPLPNNLQAMPPCTNMDFEMGMFLGWTGSIGDNNLSSAGPLQNIQAGLFSTVIDALITDCNARHTIMSTASGNDPCAPMPTVAPGGNFSVRLGNSCASYQGEILEQTFTVGPGNTSFTYQYAVVLNDGGHLAGEQPYFSIEMFDQNGNTIPCSPYFVEASGSIPGFVQCQPTIFYKPWTTVNIDLQSYVGQNVTIRFTAAGCIFGGHYGYAYIDASCLQYIITQNDSLCPGSTIQLTAPVGAQSYLWLPGNQTSQTISVNTPGTYTVTMTSVTNCTTQLTAVVTQYPMPVPAFTPTFPPCSNVYTFVNNSTIASGSMTYHWDFGEPASTADTSNSTSPVWTYNTAGTYTVTLIVTSGNGCSDTSTQVVYPGNAGLANFSSTQVCLNNPTTFTDMSAPSTYWSWNFG